MATMQSFQKSYGYCETFFFEDDSGLYAKRAEQRERERVTARLRQRELAEELSQQTAYDYQDDVLEHMTVMETETLPDVNSIDIQTEIQWFMRPYLLDFLVEAHAAFQLLPETLYLAVNILDRYCSKRVVYKRHYQLVGCAALLIAAKYGDRKDRVPLIRELKSMCCSLYDDDMFIQMEWHVLVTLNWSVGHPSIDAFLQIALSESPYDREVEHMTWYICEMAMYHKEFVSTLPSVMARSALVLARCILSKSVPEQTEWSSRYDSATVIALSQHLDTISGVLKKKFQAPALSCSSTAVTNFLERQAHMAAMAKEQSPAPTVADLETDKIVPDSADIPVTPQKIAQQSEVPYGYATPPITPDATHNMQQYIPATYDNSLCVPKPAQYMPAQTSTASAQHLPPSSGYSGYGDAQDVQQYQYYAGP